MVSSIICVMQVRCSYIRFDMDALAQNNADPAVVDMTKRRLFTYLWVSNLLSLINIGFIWTEKVITLKWLKIKG